VADDGGMSESASPSHRSSHRSFRRWIPFAGWLAVLATAMTLLGRYHGQAGDPGAVPAAWPAGETRLAPGGLDVVLFIHPRCPCTVQSIDALAEVVQHLRSTDVPVGVQVLVRTPAAGDDSAWTDGPAAQRLDALGPHVRRLDPGGTLAARWGAVTSGHVSIFAADGQRLLDGGLTPARAHAESPSVLRSIARHLAEGRPVAARPVFGCPIPDAPAEVAAAPPASRPDATTGEPSAPR
jgi:hypothetical protein